MCSAKDVPTNSHRVPAMFHVKHWGGLLLRLVLGTTAVLSQAVSNRRRWEVDGTWPVWGRERPLWRVRTRHDAEYEWSRWIRAQYPTSKQVRSNRTMFHVKHGPLVTTITACALLRTRRFALAD